MYKVCNFFVSMFFLVFFKIDFFKTKIFICFNSPGLFVHLLCLSLVQEDFRTGFIFIVALTKKKCLPLKLFLRQIGPNWGSGLSKTIVSMLHHTTGPPPPVRELGGCSRLIGDIVRLFHGFNFSYYKIVECTGVYCWRNGLERYIYGKNNRLRTKSRRRNGY